MLILVCVLCVMWRVEQREQNVHLCASCDYFACSRCVWVSMTQRVAVKPVNPVAKEEEPEAKEEEHHDSDHENYDPDHPGPPAYVCSHDASFHCPYCPQKIKAGQTEVEAGVGAPIKPVAEEVETDES